MWILPDLARSLSRIVAVTILSSAVLGCGSSSTQTSSPTSSAVPTAAPTAATTPPAAASVQPDLGLGSPSPALCRGKTYVIGYDSFSDSEAFAVQVRKSLESAAKATGCVNLKVLIDNADPATVVQNAQSFITQKVDGVISFNVLDGPNGAILSMYADAKIPVVAIALYAVGVTFVSDDDHPAGVLAGQTAANAFKAKFPGVTPTAFVGDAPQAGLVNIFRAGGIDDGIKSVFPDAKIVRVDGKGAQEQSATAMSNAIQAVPKGTKIILSGINENTVYGMYTALQRTNRVNDAVVVGVGGDQVGFNGICHLPGYVGDVAFFPDKYGDYALPAILGRINSLPVPPAAYVPVQLLTKDNIAQYYPDYSC